MSKLYSVYRIRFEDGAAYYGVTSQSLSDRMFQHSHSRHNEVLAGRFDNRQAFGVAILKDKLPKPEALAIERACIRSEPNIINLVGPGRPMLQKRTAVRMERLNLGIHPKRLEHIRDLAKEKGIMETELIRNIVYAELDRILDEAWEKQQ